MIQVKEKLVGKISVGTEKIYPLLERKTVVPTTEQQIITPDANYEGLSEVTVEAVTNEIDTNIAPENIKKGITILGVQGNYEPMIVSIDGEVLVFTGNAVVKGDELTV